MTRFFDKSIPPIVIFNRRLLFLHAIVTIVCSIIVSIVVANIIVSGVHESEFRSCHRLNILRAENNHNGYRDYIAETNQYSFDELFIRLIQLQRHRQSAGEREFIASLSSSANSLFVSANTKTWIPLTDCPQAVNTNASAPQPVRFSTRLPTQQAFVLGSRN